MIEPGKYLNPEGIVHWKSPANIALIKYWGKYPEQLPMNPSLSFVLNNSVISIKIEYVIDKGKPMQLLGFQLNEKENPAFAEKINHYLDRLSQYFLFLKHAQLKISSKSTFPHSAGIASSAAAFSALALCICSMDEQIHDKKTPALEFFKKASFMARLGSGSACRSVFDGMVVWGFTNFMPGSADEYAIKLPGSMVHKTFSNIQDTILIASSETKKVSSSAGHALMHNHPYRENRKEQAFDNLKKITHALGEGNWKMFGEIIENEALSLHSLMMSSNPGYILMRPNTISMAEKIRSFRKDTGLNVYFTLDAGPNIHLIYPATQKEEVQNFVESELVPLCENQKWIDDQMGNGPEKI